MRGCLLILPPAIWLLAAVLPMRPALPADDAPEAGFDGWRSTVRHSTIDRSQISDPADDDVLPTNHQKPRRLEAGPEWRPASNRFEDTQTDVDRTDNDGAPAEPGILRQATQSPEIGTIESPIPFGPLPRFLRRFDPKPDEPAAAYPPDEKHEHLRLQPLKFMTMESWRATFTRLPAGEDDIGLTDVDLRSTLVIPSLEENVTFTPGFQLHMIDGPTRTDLPAQLYNTQLEFRWKKQVSRPFWIELAAKPGLYSDFQEVKSETFRIVAQGLAFFAFSYETQAVVGLTYLDRFDIRFLPVVGVIHSPREDLKLNLVFPAPKLSYRLRRFGDDELWGYVASEFGGGSWAITRPVGATVVQGAGLAVIPPSAGDDMIAYRDWRLMIGLESNRPEGVTKFVEAGYVFNRELEYKSGLGDFDPDETFMLRGGLRY